MLAGGGRVGDLIRQVVSLLANETSWKDDESRRTLCFAGIVRDYGENRQKSTQKASVVTTIVAKCSKRSAFSIGFVRMQTGLHFEAFYASWISLWDKYYLQKGGQDCGLKTSLAHPTSSTHIQSKFTQHFMPGNSCFWHAHQTNWEQSS